MSGCAGRCVVDGVGDCGGDSDQADLADALYADGVVQIGLAHEGNVDVGHVGIDGDEVVAKRRVRDPPTARVADRLLEHRHADAPDGPADDLAAGKLLVDDPAAIGHRHDPCDPQHTELGVDPDLGEAGTEGACGDRAVRGPDERAAEPAQTRDDE